MTAQRARGFRRSSVSIRGLFVAAALSASALLAGCDADIVFAGHTHDVTDRTIGAIRAVNLGSVSNPTRLDRCATYVVLHVDERSQRIEHRVVEFDLAAARAAIEARHHPASQYLQRFLAETD